LAGSVVVVVGGIVVVEVVGTVVDVVVVSASWAAVLDVAAVPTQLETTIINTMSTRSDRDTKRQRMTFCVLRMAYRG
jgi:hypothetical protein